MAANRALEAEDLLDEGVYLRWESKSVRAEDTFTGVFDESDALEAFVGDVGEGGVDKIFTEDGDLGEADANSCVSFEGLGGTINCGRSAIGRFGIWSASACSCNQNQTKCLSGLVGTYLDPTPEFRQDDLPSLFTVSSPACDGRHATTHIFVQVHFYLDTDAVCWDPGFRRFGKVACRANYEAHGAPRPVLRLLRCRRFFQKRVRVIFICSRRLVRRRNHVPSPLPEPTQARKIIQIQLHGEARIRVQGVVIQHVA